ncbi:Pyruvate,phosphate dikinase [Thermobrachium celere DSM 8682]|uniref:Pyruvate,phosphate dikinase n=1 Tax=Thermobrachium celere DSM 8682 TaxID=941824 RepID=R7RPG7_9CLOT|nr:Pyruvate,phosphate dikinase [Thermobrachium celere DSM 8682]
MFSDVVMQIDKNLFENILDEIKEQNNAKYDTDLTAENLKEVVKRYKELYRIFEYLNILLYSSLQKFRIIFGCFFELIMKKLDNFTFHMGGTFE